VLGVIADSLLEKRPGRRDIPLQPFLVNAQSGPLCDACVLKADSVGNVVRHPHLVLVGRTDALAISRIFRSEPVERWSHINAMDPGVLNSLPEFVALLPRRADVSLCRQFPFGRQKRVEIIACAS
jgi:hypothetical protein